MKLTLISTLSFSLVLFTTVRAQTPPEEDGTGTERVQYVLILPEEKTPDLVRPEENNPFEASADSKAEKEGSTEENMVRDLLLSMKVGGAVSGTNGMRVMLGGMRLETGVEVPLLIPDQQVALRVKEITPTAIELIWVEKKPTGLPPKSLIIPIEGAPSVRYQMPAGALGAQGTSVIHPLGIIRKNGVSSTSPSMVAPTPSVVKAEPVTPDEVPAKNMDEAPSSPPPASNAPEASILRMLFGNRPPAAK